MKTIALSKMQAATIALQMLITCIPVTLKGQHSAGTLAERTLARPDVRWIHRRTADANVYVLSGSAPAGMLTHLASESQRAIEANVQWLGERSSRGRLNLFFVGSRDEMRAFTGTRSGGWSVVAEGTAFLVASDSISPALRHEVMHLLSWRLWGTPGGVWMSEGVATAAVGGCRDWTLDEIAAALYHDRQLATIAEMRRRFRNGGTQGAIHYLSAGSLVEFIDRTWGRVKLRQLWQSGGMGGAERVLGITPLTLEQRWRSHVAEQAAPEQWNVMRRQVAALGCE
jgi:hypothetical protein